MMSFDPNTMLWGCITRGDSEGLKTWLTNTTYMDGNAREEGGDGLTPLMWGIKNAKPDICMVLLEASSVDVNILNASGKNALMMAIEMHDLDDVMSRLIEKTRTDAVDLEGYSMVMLSAMHNRPTALRKLIEHGYPLWLTGKDGWNAKSLALSQNHSHIFKVLKQASQRICNGCGQNDVDVKVCPCKSVCYCSTECQSQQWKLHKPICKALREKVTLNTQ